MVMEEVSKDSRKSNLSPKKKSGIPDGLSIQVQDETALTALDGEPQPLVCIRCHQSFQVAPNVLQSRTVEYCIPCYRSTMIRISQEKLVFRPNHINKHVYLGGIRTAENLAILQELNITRVVVVGAGLTCHFPDNIRYFQIDIEDRDDQNIAQYFLPAIEFIQSSSDNVLVHCYAGVSRSASLVVAYFMYSLRISLEEAIRLVKSKRSCISPNFGFMLQLKEFEKQVFQEKPQDDHDHQSR